MFSAATAAYCPGGCNPSLRIYAAANNTAACRVQTKPATNRSRCGSHQSMSMRMQGGRRPAIRRARIECSRSAATAGVQFRMLIHRSFERWLTPELCKSGRSWDVTVRIVQSCEHILGRMPFSVRAVPLLSCLGVTLFADCRQCLSRPCEVHHTVVLRAP